MTGELAAARRELEARGVLATTAASEAAQVRQTGEAAAQQLSQALAEERERVAALTRDLATARREIEARIATAATAAEPAASAGAPPRPTPKEERQKADLPTGESAALGAPTSRDPGSAQRSVAPDPQALTEAKKLLTRADALLGRGDISAARIVLGRALDLGSPQAAFRLAESYDPIVLSARRALGTRPDPARARELYAQAYEGGIQEAKDRMDALR
jgi:TPR repeat protein